MEAWLHDNKVDSIVLLFSITYIIAKKNGRNILVSNYICRCRAGIRKYYCAVLCTCVCLCVLVLEMWLVEWMWLVERMWLVLVLLSLSSW